MDKIPEYEYPETPIASIKAFEAPVPGINVPYNPNKDVPYKKSLDAFSNCNHENPLEVQIGGSHYKDCVIQPIEYIKANDLGFLEGCIIKRVTRHKHETGKGRQDIEKAIHELQLILKYDYS